MPCEVTCSTAPHSVAEEPRFVMDFSMYKVAKYFRLLGYDTLCSRHLPQKQLIPTACREDRTLVTSSRLVVQSVEAHNRRTQAMQGPPGVSPVGPTVTRRVVAYNSDGESVYSGDGEAAENVEVRYLFIPPWRSRDFGHVMVTLIWKAALTYDAQRVFTRCVTCNALLVPVAKKEVRNRVVTSIFEMYEDFTECPVCQKVFWGFDGKSVINYKSFRTLTRLRTLCISAGAPVERERTTLTHLSCFRSFPRLTKALVFSYLGDADLANVVEVFPVLRSLAEEVQESQRTGKPVRKLHLSKP